VSDYQIIQVGELDDYVGEEHPGEMRGVARGLGSEQLALTHRVLPPGAGALRGDRTIGHTHNTQEEIYYVISGTLTMKIGDEEIDVGPRSAALLPPPTPRSYANLGEEDVEFLIASVKADDIRAEVEMKPDFWPE
jgi:mannose-6-phosphate isomerase-like protein (cupin superfamily)